jgi:hypothetical protein
LATHAPIADKRCKFPWKGDPTVEPVYDVLPVAVLEVDGKTVKRGDVSLDWGSRMQWKVMRDGKPVATVTALRTEATYDHKDETPGKYQVVLQMFKYVNYKKTGPGGEYVDSKYVDISNTVTFTI